MRHIVYCNNKKACFKSFNKKKNQPLGLNVPVTEETLQSVYVYVFIQTGRKNQILFFVFLHIQIKS